MIPRLIGVMGQDQCLHSRSEVNKLQNHKNTAAVY